MARQLLGCVGGGARLNSFERASYTSFHHGNWRWRPIRCYLLCSHDPRHLLRSLLFLQDHRKRSLLHAFVYAFLRLFSSSTGSQGETLLQSFLYAFLRLCLRFSTPFFLFHRITGRDASAVLSLRLLTRFFYAFLRSFLSHAMRGRDGAARLSLRFLNAFFSFSTGSQGGACCTPFFTIFNAFLRFFSLFHKITGRDASALLSLRFFKLFSLVHWSMSRAAEITR